MSFIFYNNFPYDNTIFPSMDENVDPVNNEYFTGLHTEIENIESFCLGHTHTGGSDGAILFGALIDPPEIIAFAGYANQGMYSGARTGFYMYDNVYFGPGSGHTYIQSINVNDMTWNNIASGASGGISYGCASDGTYIYFPVASNPTEVVKYNPATQDIVIYTMAAGNNCAGECCILSQYLYLSIMGSPGKIARMLLSDGTFTYFTLEAGEDDPRGMDTDGTYIYSACCVNPVLIIKFDPDTTTHTTHTISTLTTSVYKLKYANNVLWALQRLSSNQLVRIYPDTMNFQTFNIPMDEPPGDFLVWTNYVLINEGITNPLYSHAFIPNLLNIRKGAQQAPYAFSYFLVQGGDYLWGADDSETYELRRYTCLNLPAL